MKKAAKAQMQEAMERISEEIVLADCQKLQELANMHKKIGEISSLAAKELAADVPLACNAVADLIQAIILENVDNPEESFIVVSQAIAALQQVIRDGRSIHEVNFPESLAIDLKMTDTEGIQTGIENSTIEEPRSPQPNAGEPPQVEMPVVEEEDLTPIPLKGDPGLLADFISEANEHLDSADINLLTLETSPKEMEALNAVFRCFHTIKGVAGFLALDEIRMLAHESENLLDKARKGELELVDVAMDVTFEAVDLMKGMVASLKESLESGTDLPRERRLRAIRNKLSAVVSGQPCQGKQPTSTIQISKGQRVGDVLVESGYVTQDDISDALIEQKISGTAAPKIGEILVKNGKVEAKNVAEALRAQKGEGIHGCVQVKESLKVDADRLDFLVDTIGELVIAESMVSQSEELNAVASPNLARQINLLNKITRELQEMGTALRMVPVRPTFQKMARLLRDLSKKAGKKIEFVTRGEETELDKSVIDQIGDPLVHMIRNSVDHGIEANAEDRIKAGKPEEGRVVLSAYHKGGNIFIEIEDDGQGIDRDALLKKAIERQIIKETDILSDNEVLALIFEPGLSTAKKISDVSGRGVGMDVVRRNIESLRGQIMVSSEKGIGSKITIQLPLTLAIIDGMVVRVGNQKFIIPTVAIVRSLCPDTANVSTVMKKGELLNVHGELIPIVRLGRLLEITEASDTLTNGIVIVVEDEGRKSGLFVDELLGQQQIVIKSLGETMRGIHGISGAAIMPDGSVSLILDISKLEKLVMAEEKRTGSANSNLALQQPLTADPIAPNNQITAG